MTGQTYKMDDYSLRLFNSITLNTNYEHVLSLFATRQLWNGDLGAVFVTKDSHNTQQDDDQYGFSIFANQTFHKNIMCFARYDNNKKHIDSQTQEIIWAGLQYTFKKHLKASIYYKSEDFDTNYYGLGFFIH